LKKRNKKLLSVLHRDILDLGEKLLLRCQMQRDDGFQNIEQPTSRTIGGRSASAATFQAIRATSAAPSACAASPAARPAASNSRSTGTRALLPIPAPCCVAGRPGLDPGQPVECQLVEKKEK